MRNQSVFIFLISSFQICFGRCESCEDLNILLFANDRNFEFIDLSHTYSTEFRWVFILSMCVLSYRRITWLITIIKLKEVGNVDKSYNENFFFRNGSSEICTATELSYENFNYPLPKSQRVSNIPLNKLILPCKWILSVQNFHMWIFFLPHRT